MKTVEFNNKLYVVEPGVGVPSDAINPEDLSGPEQVELFNLLGSNLGIDKRVNKFSDRKKGAARIIDRLKTWGDEEEIEEATAAPEPKAAPAPKAKPAPKKKEASERKKRGMRFVFPFNGDLRTLRNMDTLRGQCVTLLKEGATFKEVEELVVRFDQDRNKKPEHVERRAYELVRIMHYYVGYGISHDMETGIIKLHKRAPGA